MRKEDLPWRCFADKGDIAGKWCRFGTPTFYVIDADGIIRHKWIGSPGEAALDAALDARIREAEAKSAEKPD